MRSNIACSFVFILIIILNVRQTECVAMQMVGNGVSKRYTIRRFYRYCYDLTKDVKNKNTKNNGTRYLGWIKIIITIVISEGYCVARFSVSICISYVYFARFCSLFFSFSSYFQSFLWFEFRLLFSKKCIMNLENNFVYINLAI